MKSMTSLNTISSSFNRISLCYTYEVEGFHNVFDLNHEFFSPTTKHLQISVGVNMIVCLYLFQ